MRDGLAAGLDQAVLLAPQEKELVASEVEQEAESMFEPCGAESFNHESRGDDA
ncbi:MAG TPA: hypothetical protein VLT33_35915 [Labilithrix sp.]|nr:hypothetical protein [Labilithrix sp.]